MGKQQDLLTTIRRGLEKFRGRRNTKELREELAAEVQAILEKEIPVRCTNCDGSGRVARPFGPGYAEDYCPMCGGNGGHVDNEQR